MSIRSRLVQLPPSAGTLTSKAGASLPVMQRPLQEVAPAGSYPPSVWNMYEIPALFSSTASSVAHIPAKGGGVQQKT